MMVAVLLGALSLGACVDDNESQSVTNIRDAKAEQMRALANLYNAQAEAEATAAAAEAQLTAAKAAYKQALADAAAADAAMKEELLRQAQEKFALEIQAIEADYAQQVAYFNMLKAKYEKNMFGHEETLLTDVYDAYTTAQDKVNTLTQQKMRKQVEKAQVEAEVISADEAVKQQIADWNTQLKLLQRDLEKLNKMKEAQPSKDEYLAMLDEAEQKAYDILNNDARTAKATEASKEKAFAEASKELQEGKSYAFVLAANELKEIQNELNSTLASTYPFVTSDDINLAEDAIDAYTLKWGTSPANANLESKPYAFTFTNNYAVVSTTVELAELQTNNAFADALEKADDNISEVTGEEWDLEDYTDPTKSDVVVSFDADGDGLNETYISVNAVKGYIAYYEAEIAEAEKEIERLKTVKAGEEAKGDAADDDLVEAYQSQIEYYEALIAGGKGTYKDGVNPDRNYNISEESSYEGRLALAEKEGWDIEAQAALNKMNAAKAEITELQKEYTAILAEFKKAENQKAYTDAIAALETPAKEYVEAQDAAEEFDEQLADLGFEEYDGSYTYLAGEEHLEELGLQPTGNGTYAEIKTILNGIYDVQDLIDQKSQAIADIKSQIQASTALGALAQIVNTNYSYWDPIAQTYQYASGVIIVVTDGLYGDITLEDAVAVIDAAIAYYDAQIEVQQALADKYKAQLDALLASDDENIDTPVEPETPAEDETPSEEQPSEEQPAA